MFREVSKCLLLQCGWKYQAIGIETIKINANKDTKSAVNDKTTTTDTHIHIFTHNFHVAAPITLYIA